MKKFLSLILHFSFLSFVLFSQQDEYFEIKNENYTITIVGFTGKEKNIQIPSHINSVPVTAIGEFAFRNITSVILPDGIVSIGTGAFTNNQLTSIIIPESVLSIGNIAFQSNKLQEVILPPHITSIGQLAFADNQLKNIIIPDKVTFIMDGAFADNYLEEIIIPNSVAEIGNGAFENNPLRKITIGANVQLNYYEVNDYIYYPFEESFCLFYIECGKKAGAYIKNNETWIFLNEENN